MDFKNLTYFDSLIPALFIDDFLPAAMLEKFEENWPEFQNCQDVFATPGSREQHLVILDGFQEGSFGQSGTEQRRKTFWKDFIETQNQKIIKSINSEFLPFFLKKYYKEDLNELVPNYIGLRTVNLSAYQGLDKHVHYYHDPLWLFTYFIYLDDDLHGLSLYRYKTPENATNEEIFNRNFFMASPAFKGERRDHLVEDCKLDFRRNRLVVMLNSSISWHGVDPMKTGSNRMNGNGRRHLVGHIMLPKKLIHKYFGFDAEEWPQKHLTELPSLYSNIKKDIDHSIKTQL